MVKIRKMPIICLLNGWIHLLSHKVKFSKELIGKTINMPDGHTYTVFRHMYKSNSDTKANGSILMINFKFRKFSYRVNKILSLIPIPLIAGFPGFYDKVWMYDPISGFWYGLYQWENDSTIEDYQKSFVLRVMNSRADKKSITMKQISKCSLQEFLEGYC